VQFFFIVFLIPYACIFRNRPKEFYRSRRICQKYLNIFGGCAKSLEACPEITAIFEWFYLYDVDSEYAKSISACSENRLTTYKRNRKKERKFIYLLLAISMVIKITTGTYLFILTNSPRIFCVVWRIRDRHKTEPISAKSNSDPISPFYTPLNGQKNHPTLLSL
jgi:hypothetical protein